MNVILLFCIHVALQTNPQNSSSVTDTVFGTSLLVCVLEQWFCGLRLVMRPKFERPNHFTALDTI